MRVLEQKKRPFLAAELGQEGTLDVRGELFARAKGLAPSPGSSSRPRNCIRGATTKGRWWEIPSAAGSNSGCLPLQENQDPLSYFHMETLVMTTHNLFFVGTETVSTTLRYGFLLLMKYPEIQAKVHAEIDQVIGRHRSPSVEDRSRMPYTDAVIHEVQRFGDVVPMGLPHAVTRDTHFRGFLLPEGTNVLPLLFSVHNDPAQFKDPATFDPAHFLDPSGGFRKHDAFMAFSAGKRVCLGEAMARMELFLLFTTVLQRFTLTPLVRPEDIDISPLMSGLGNMPHPYEFRAVPR
ncbi:cytochrome P450 2F2-like [Trachemys scripta elegans]|uniref:cytochrome P450 2F2-like n=1 Tax=Trachemys scripta elegans TaxID=31138 RepID=UPI00155458EF|nr:cytochrome P450 2F2-like [Trachemys scripta elegans]